MGKKYIVWLIIVFIFFGILYNCVTPFNQAPDEIGHWNYIEHLAANFSLPNSKLIRNSGDGFAEFHQPPFYYLLNVPFLLALRKIAPSYQFAFLGFISTLLGAATLFVIAKSACLVFKDFYLRILVPLTVMASPMFIYIHSVINNDALANFLGAVIIWFCLKMLSGKWEDKYFFWAGSVIGFSLLTKLIIYPLSLILLCLVFKETIKKRQIGKYFFTYTLIPIVFISWWWFAFNLKNTGTVLGWRWEELIGFWQEQRKDFNAENLRLWFSNFFESFWAVFGWSDIRLKEGFYLVLKIISGISFAGLVCFLVENWRKMKGFKKHVFWFFAVSVSAIGLLLFKYNIYFFQPQGRYIFPIMTIFAAGFSRGLYHFIPRARLKGLLAAGFLAVIWVNLMCILFLAGLKNF